MARNGRDTHEKIYAYLQSCAGRSFPTVREIAAACGLRSPSCVHKHLVQLEQEGRIVREDGLARSARVPAKSTAMVPLVGRVAAGVPITAVEWVEDYLPLPMDLTGDAPAFALRVVGESMKNAGILDGDLVICRQTNTAENGDIVVAMIDDETTVKRFFRRDGAIVLQPDNPDFTPIVARDVVLLGKVAAVLRTYQ